MMKFKIVCLLFLCCTINSFSQTKNEKESRIDLNAFPEGAKELISPLCSMVKRIRHYRETDGNHSSFESKFKYKKHWYSVEFNTNGKLEDIEVTIKERHIEDATRLVINSYFKTQFQKYDILKIQEQYIADTTAEKQNYILHVLEHRTSIPSNFEIVVAVKTKDNWELREMTFNMEGVFLNERIIQQDSYEYIMY